VIAHYRQQKDTEKKGAILDLNASGPMGSCPRLTRHGKVRTPDRHGRQKSPRIGGHRCACPESKKGAAQRKIKKSLSVKKRRGFPEGFAGCCATASRRDRSLACGKTMRFKPILRGGRNATGRSPLAFRCHDDCRALYFSRGQVNTLRRGGQRPIPLT